MHSRLYAFIKRKCTHVSQNFNIQTMHTQTYTNPVLYFVFCVLWMIMEKGKFEEEIPSKWIKIGSELNAFYT